MPTGYTAAIADGITFETFALNLKESLREGKIWKSLNILYN
jgi:hypothetical protein